MLLSFKSVTWKLHVSHPLTSYSPEFGNNRHIQLQEKLTNGVKILCGHVTSKILKLWKKGNAYWGTMSGSPK